MKGVRRKVRDWSQYSKRQSGGILTSSTLGFVGRAKSEESEERGHDFAASTEDPDEDPDTHNSVVL
jgi:hypothetical protein